MAWIIYLAVVALAIGLVLWGRAVWRKHEQENLYEPTPESESHAKDPFYVETMGEGFHGGHSGPGM
ncbi:MAG: hypothetical protein KY391_00645 [Actinobacteria bacterium]|nr:hypothetical protein [Actinomycetota bacterium]